MKGIDKVGSKLLRVILRRMKALGITQTELARRMKASRPYVTKVLNGDVNITIGTASRFARALGMDFFCGMREPGPKESGGLYDEA